MAKTVGVRLLSSFFFATLIFSSGVFGCKPQTQPRVASLSASVDTSGSRPRNLTPPALETPDFVGLWINAEKNFPLLPFIASAKNSIDIEIYAIDSLAVRNQIRAVMNDPNKKVTVRVIKEARPNSVACPLFSPESPGENALCKDLRAFMKDVLSHGGAFVPFNNPELCAPPGGTRGHRCYEHGKMIIVDKKFALISTGNFDPTSICDLSQRPGHCNRDYSVITDDTEVLAALNEIFARDLEGKRYDLASILTPNIAQKLTVSPLSLLPLTEFIDKATTSIEIANQYLTDKTLNTSLLRAAGKGVKVSVTVASACFFAKPNNGERYRLTQTYTAFDQAKIDSRFFTRRVRVFGQPGYLHAKTIVIDGTRAWVGSVNGSTTALTLNREFGLFFDRPDWVAKLLAAMRADHTDPNTESWQESLDCLKDDKASPAESPEL